MRATGPTSALDVGLSRERTTLSWTRTALALVANGGLVLVRHERAFPLPVSVALATLSCAVAALVVAASVRRSGLVALPDTEVRAVAGLVVPLGVAVTALCLATLVATLVWR